MIRLTERHHVRLADQATERLKVLEGSFGPHRLQRHERTAAPLEEGRPSGIGLRCQCCGCDQQRERRSQLTWNHAPLLVWNAGEELREDLQRDVTTKFNVVTGTVCPR